jgi:hypothetical protein
LAVVLGATAALVAACESGNGALSYKVSTVRTVAVSSSALSVSFNATNKGHEVGAPACTIIVTGPGDVKNIERSLLSPVEAGNVDITVNWRVAVRDHAAKKISPKDVAVSCS